MQEEEEEEENRLAEAAERRFGEEQRAEHEAVPATTEQPEVSGASFVNISFDLEPEPPLSTQDTNRVPSALPSWGVTLTEKNINVHTFWSVSKSSIYLTV